MISQEERDGPQLVLLAALSPLGCQKAGSSAGREPRRRRSRRQAAASWSRFRPASSRWGAGTVATKKNPCTRSGSTPS